MLLNKERMLKKMEEFKLDARHRGLPGECELLVGFSKPYPLHVPIFFMESFALFPRRADISPALIIGTVDVSWAARFPSWIKEIYTFGNPYFVLPGREPMEGEIKFMKMMDDRRRGTLRLPERRSSKPSRTRGWTRERSGLTRRVFIPGLVKR